jgi:hypothetical protein
VPRDPYRESAGKSRAAAARRLLEVYAVGSRAALHRQPEGVRHTLALLRKTLDPSQAPDIALSLSAIYDDIEVALEREDYGEVSRLFEELRGLWLARINYEDLQQ